MAAHMLAFLQPGDDKKPPYLGFALKLHTVDATRQCLAGKFLYQLLLHSGQSRRLAEEMLKECLETDEVRAIVFEVYQRAPHELPPITVWADRMLAALPPTPPEDPNSGPLPALNRLASHYLTHLCIAMWNPPGPSTPPESTHPTPDRFRWYTIQNLRYEAGTLKRSSALKTLVERRDGFFCPVSGWGFTQTGGGIVSEIAHILPFSMHAKTVTHAAIEVFTGNTIDSASILSLINQPDNAILLEHHAHHAFDASFAWGIEALSDPDGTTRYFVRAIRSNAIPHQVMGHKIDEEIFFGRGEQGDEIAAPDPRFCNLKLNVFRVLYASGAAEVLEKFWRDYDRISLSSSALGVSEEMDNLLLAKLATISV